MELSKHKVKLYILAPPKLPLHPILPQLNVYKFGLWGAANEMKDSLKPVLREEMVKLHCMVMRTKIIRIILSCESFKASLLDYL